MGQRTTLEQLLDSITELDSETRADFLMETAGRFREVPAELAVRPYPAEHRVPACESQVYIWVRKEREGVKFYYAVENPQGISAKALAVILDETLSGEQIEHIRAVDPAIIHKIFGGTVSMAKVQGLMGMVLITKRRAETLL